MKKLHLLTLLVLIPMISCAYTDITSFKDPEFAGVNYSNIIVVFKNDNLKIVKMGEEIFQKEFVSKGISTKKGLDVLLPTRNYTMEEELALLQKNNIDAVLIVDFKSAHTEKDYHYTKGRVSTTKTDYLTFNISLKDVNKGKDAWTASTTTQGDNLSMEIYLESLASTVFDRLVADSLIIVSQ